GDSTITRLLPLALSPSVASSSASSTSGSGAGAARRPLPRNGAAGGAAPSAGALRLAAGLAVLTGLTGLPATGPPGSAAAEPAGLPAAGLTARFAGLVSPAALLAFFTAAFAAGSSVRDFLVAMCELPGSRII